MAFSRYGHVNNVFVKVGDMVKVGQKIATNGTGNGQWLAHLHRDHPKVAPDGNFGFYNIGWTKEKTLATFADPNSYPKALGAWYSHLGLGWLQYWNYGTDKAPKMCFHPGLDENGKGSGDADYDAPVYAVADGIVRYVYDGTGSNGGWGHLIVVEEIINNEPMQKEFVEAVEKLLGEEYGDNLNDSEQKDAAGKLKEVKAKLEWCNQLELTNKRLLENNEIIANKLAEEKLKYIESVASVEEMKKTVREYTDKAGICEPALATCQENLRVQSEKAKEGIEVYGALELLVQAVKRMFNK